MREPGPARPSVPGSSPHTDRYDRTTVVLHWITAVLVALLFAIGQSIDLFPRGAPRIGARSLHILAGATLLAVLVARIAWRIGWGRRLPAAAPGLAHQLARSAHVVLYLLLAVTIVLGVANAWIRGDNILGLFTIPSVAPGNEALRELVEDLHGTLADLTVIVAALHAVVALVHHSWIRDDVLRRMLPGLNAR